MSINRVQLSGKDILEKDFKTAMRGYNQEEVDEFLDIIIQDYDLFKQEVDRLQAENEKLRKILLTKQDQEHHKLLVKLIMTY